MKRARLAAAVVYCLLSAFACEAVTITPVDIRGTSQWGDTLGWTVVVSNLIDGSGLSDPPDAPTPDDVLDDLHDNDEESANAWFAGPQSAGIEGGEGGDSAHPPVGAEQILEFDFGEIVRIDDLYIWQQNQGGAFGAPAPMRGVHEFEMTATLAPPLDDEIIADIFTSIGVFSLAPESGLAPVPAQLIELDESVNARRVRFNILSAQSALAREFVGLSEVRFAGDEPARIPGDYNFDFSVNAPDYNVWRDSFGDQGDDLPADGNADLEVNAPDYNIWRDNFGRTLDIGAGASVPEPATLVLLTLALMAVAAGRR